jgi:hypothetical protein
MAKLKEQSGETADLIGFFDGFKDHPKDPDSSRPKRSKITISAAKQKEAFRTLTEFQRELGVPEGSDLIADHNDPLVRWAAKVTKTLTQKEARSSDYSFLDWKGGIEKECGTMRKFGVLGEVYPRDEVTTRKHYNEAQLLGAWAVKNFELTQKEWEARYRCVYGGHQPIRADGSTALYVSSASLPASLRDMRIFSVIASLYSWDIFAGDVTVHILMLLPLPTVSFVCLMNR